MVRPRVQSKILGCTNLKIIMENTQSVQEQPSKPKAPTSAPENSKSQQTDSRNLIHVLMHHPWLLVIGLLAIFLGGGVLSLYSLGYVGFVQQAKPEEEALQAEVVQPTNTQSETTNPISLWMVAAIALSCASGCLIIFRWLNRPAQHQKVRKPKNRYQERLAKRRTPIAKSLPPKKPPVFLPLQPQTSAIPTSAETKPVVTVLPPDQSFTGGKSKESLASMLDIRKQTSLSAILRKD